MIKLFTVLYEINGLEIVGNFCTSFGMRRFVMSKVMVSSEATLDYVLLKQFIVS